MSKPTTIDEAVQKLLKELPDETIQLIRGSQKKDLVEHHFGIGMWIRNEFGLWDSDSPLLTACGVEGPDEASGKLLEVFRCYLVNTATPVEMQEAQQVRATRDTAREKSRDKWLEREAEKDSVFTSRKCYYCSQPLPSYRKTCKRCGKPAKAK